jgi:putative ABC transport system permease protein
MKRTHASGLNLLRHYFVVAFRNLGKHKAFSFINVAGLALGMFTCLVIVMLVAEHISYDSHNTRADRIYRVITYNEKIDRHVASSPYALGQELLEKVSGVEQVVRFQHGFGNVIGNRFLEKSTVPVAGLFADPGVFDLFEYELEFGDARTALIDPYSVVLTKSTCRKLFKVENPVGEMIDVGGSLYKVTGVLRETNKKSHVIFEALASLVTLESIAAKTGDEKKVDAMGDLFGRSELYDWRRVNSGWTYFLLEPGKSAISMQEDLAQTAKEHYSGFEGDDAAFTFGLQKLRDITPSNARHGNEIGPVLDGILISMIVVLALAILGTSVFNFTNLSIARSLSRAKEIGVRKVSGASRAQIFFQFLSESVVISIMALCFSVVLIFLVKDYFLDLTLIRLTQWDLTANGYVFGFFVLFAIVVGIIAGLFPAAVLSKFAPIKVLRNLYSLGLASRTGLRNFLIVSQFTIALIFIITTIVVYNQLDLFLHADHGFNVKHNIMVNLNKTQFEPLRNELLRQSAIDEVTAASHLPATFFGNHWERFRKPLEKEWTEYLYYSVDESYLRNISVPLVAGRFFSPDAGPSNKNFIVINEEAVKAFQYNSPAAALGQTIVTGLDSAELEVIGVIRNYNHTMLTQTIAPMMLVYRPQQYDILQVSYKGSYEDAAGAVERAWASVNPGVKAEYMKAEDEVFKFYNLIMRDLVDMLMAIAGMAITICCLGMLGIVSYVTETRAKEISIRKVFGSSNAVLVALLSKGFVRMVLVAALVGVPIAYLINNSWLQNIAYHTSVSAGVIVFGVMIMMGLAGLTICSQTFRSTRVRAIDNLRSE